MLLHDKIRSLREQQNWTQEEMAQHIEMSKNGYAKIERGESKVNLERLEKIATVFDMDVVELINHDKGFVYWGDHNGNNTNYYGNNENFIYEIEKLKQTLHHQSIIIEKNNELLAQKDSEIATLKEMVRLLQQSKEF